MVASDYGITALLPYLKQILHIFKAAEVHARRVRLVWQVKEFGWSYIIEVDLPLLTLLDITVAAEELFNIALYEETQDNVSKILFSSAVAEYQKRLLSSQFTMNAVASRNILVVGNVPTFIQARLQYRRFLTRNFT